MAKRFTDSEKWRDKWFRGLPAEHKLVWLYILDNCDHAGVLELDEELAEFQIGSVIDWPAFFVAANGRVERLGQDKLWVVRFIQYQYGELSVTCNAHNPVFASLRKHGLDARVSEGYLKGTQRVQDMDKDKDKDMDKDKDKDRDKDSEGPKTRKRKARAAARPADVSESIWDDWMTVRAAKRAGPATDTAVTRLRAEADKAGLSLSEALETCVSRSWVGFDASWFAKDSRAGPAIQTFAAQRAANTERAIEEFLNG